MEHLAGWFFLGLVVAGFAAMNFVMKLATLKGHASPVLTAALFAAAAVLCLAVLVVSGRPWLVSAPVVLLAAGGGIGGAVAYFFFLSALKTGPYALSISIYTMAFLLPVAFAVAVWSRPLTGPLAAALLFIVAGVALISWSGAAAGGETRGARARWLALLGAAFVLTAVPQLAQAAAVRQGEINLWFFLFATFASGGAALWIFLAAAKTRPSAGAFGYAGLAAVGSVAGNFFTLKALSRLPETAVFPVANAGPIIAAVLLGLLYFKERIRPLAWLGIAAGIAGIVLLAR